MHNNRFSIRAFLVAVALSALVGYQLRSCTNRPAEPTQPAPTTAPGTVAIDVSIIWQRGFTREYDLDVYPMLPDPYDQYDGLVVENPSDRTLRAHMQLVFYYESTPVAVRLDRPVTVPARTLTELRFDSVGRTPRPTHAILFISPTPTR